MIRLFPTQYRSQPERRRGQVYAFDKPRVFLSSRLRRKRESRAPQSEPVLNSIEDRGWHIKSPLVPFVKGGRESVFIGVHLRLKTLLFLIFPRGHCAPRGQSILDCRSPVKSRTCFGFEEIIIPFVVRNQSSPFPCDLPFPVVKIMFCFSGDPPGHPYGSVKIICWV